MLKLIKIHNTFTSSKKEKILRSVGASISEKLLYTVEFDKKSIFVLCENKFFWLCNFNDKKADFECYEAQGNLERNKNLPATIFFEDKIETVGNNKKSFTTLSLKNSLITRRFDLNFVLTGEEKTALKYFFETYFRNESLSENFKMPKEKAGRIITLKKEVFFERVNKFFGKTEQKGFETKEEIKSFPDGKILIEKKKFSSLLNCLDFFADIAYLFTIVCFLKSDFLAEQVFSENFSYLNFFSEKNVLKVYIIFALGIFSLFKLFAVLLSKDSLKVSCILLFIIHGTTLFLISDLMIKTSFFIRLTFFMVLNLLIYFCFQFLIGNIFIRALQKFILLIICGLLIFLLINAMQTISNYIDLVEFGQKFLKNLTLQ